MRGLRLVIALVASAAMLVSLPAAGLAQEVAEGQSYTGAVLSDGAVAHWRLAETSGTVAADTLGNHDATYEGSPTLGESPLQTSDGDSAVSFDGVDDIVKIANSSEINTGSPITARTIELWFEADATWTRQVLFEEGGGSRGLAMYLHHDRVYFIGWNKKNDDATTPWGASWVSAPVEAGTPYHVALVHDKAAGKVKGFLNGSLVGTISGVGKLYKHTAKVAIGAMHDDVRFHNQNITNPGTNFHFAGTIDEVAIYNSVLTGSQLANHVALGGGTVGTAPTVDIAAPTPGSQVASAVTLHVVADDDVDPEGSLTVEYRVDSGNWNDMAFNSDLVTYDAVWDTTLYSEGIHAIKVRAYDSNGASRADNATFTVANTSPYASEALADGAVAYWRLGESSGTTAGDLVGSVDGTYGGSPDLTAEGLIGGDADSAVDFDGSNDYIGFPGSTAVNQGGPFVARTIELWFQADDVSSRQVLFEEGGTSRGMSMYLDDGYLYFGGWNVLNDDATTPWGPEFIATPVATDTVYHAVMTLDSVSGEFTGYVNGFQVGMETGAGKLFGHNAKVGVGAMNDDVRFHDGGVTNNGKDYFFNGVIDEVAVYNAALSSGTVEDHTLAGQRNIAVPPTVFFESPTGSIDLNGTVDIDIHADDEVDAKGSLAVQWRLDGGTWNSTTYNGSVDHYEASWNTATASDGSHELEVRALDSDGAWSTDRITVTLDNSSAYANEVAADGAIAHWRLGESSGTNAADAVGSHTATYMGSPTLGATGVQIGDGDSAVDFDGADDYVAIANSPDINTGGPYAARTIELWFNADEVTSRQVLFEEGGLSRGLAIYLDDGDLYFTAWNDRNDDPNSPWGPIWVTESVVAGESYHVVMVLDGTAGTITAYVDGVFEGTATGGGDLYGHSARVAVGAMDDDVYFHDGAITDAGQDFFFSGTIDDVAIYNTVLTSTQVSTHTVLGGGTPPIT